LALAIVTNAEPSQGNVFSLPQGLCVALQTLFMTAMIMSLCSCRPAESRPKNLVPSTEFEHEIEKVLSDQVAAWNRGDLPGFMQAYWQSDKLSFSSGGSTRRGWKSIHDHYQAKYGGKSDLGQLSFTDLEVSLLNPDHALVLGRWHLATGESAMEGNFSLVVRHIDENWVIIHDHTSLAESPN
jgi:uncharacterized protein (TIGR02246 family)